MMAYKCFLPSVLLLVLILGQDVQGRLTKDSKVKSLKVSSLKGLFDCVDIYEQPAFDHPLLKDHKLQIKPTWKANDFTDKRSSTIPFETVDCPEGTIPIRRRRNHSAVYSPEDTPLPDQARASITVVADEGKLFYGASATMNVLNLPVCDDQAVQSLVGIQSYIFGNQMYFGWAVDPSTYGDRKTHLYTYWQGDNGGCSDLLCDGFVHVNHKIPVGAVFDESQISIYDVMQYEIKFSIALDQASNNWWATFPGPNVDLGYWPGSLFPGLPRGAPLISFGANGRAPYGRPFPLLGFARFPQNNLMRSGYLAEMEIMHRDGQRIGLEAKVIEYNDCPDIYGLKYYGPSKYGYTLEFGGPGGPC